MDNDTRDFITLQSDKTNRAIEKLRDSMDTKLTGLQTILAEQNLKLGQGSERFRAIDTRFNDNNKWYKTLSKNNDKWNKALLTLIILALTGLAGLALKVL